MLKKGLKIIFVGEIPNNNVFSDDKDINSIMEKIIKQENVVCVDSVDDVVNALKEKNIVADANYNNQTLLSNHQKTKNNDYYFIYNYGGTNNYREVENVQNVKTEITLKGEGKPYLADAWTGKITPIVNYKKDKDRITVDVDIAGND